MAGMTATGVHVHRAERADVLADALALLLARPLADPFAAEVVAVPAKGIERWLAQRLSHHLGAPGGDGICAGVAFRSPAGVIAEVVAAAAGMPPDEDPWRPERAVWPLLEVLDAAAQEPWSAPLRAHRVRRLALARRVVELFTAYAIHRPELLRGWVTHADEVDLELAWQPELWRRLRARIGGPDPAERVDAACAALRADPAVVGAAGAAVAVRPDPARRPAAGGARRAWRRTASPPVAAASLAGAVGEAWPHVPGRRPPRRRIRRAAAAAPPAAVVARPRRPRDAGAALAALPERTDHHHPRRRSRRRHCCGRLQRDLRDDRRTRRHSCAPPATGASRCTPATARPARSRCCARCCSGCSPTTPPWSRATCW